ncbi:hypothetical protein [Neorhodopirellula pilleata]|uniref:Uncharacterized protein n=1 Tax=Neorhodopirellula pilleata TaxID=2714738 RepID=A0A5C5ZPA9_9BACT|nr:hypothetical protein [Neorhodopirellula pilleata]TWT89324.1 hypothetical protein Pla100_56410 [Neorhodopirellula pilleata]
MNAFVLEEHRNLFRDEQAFLEFAQAIRAKLKEDFSPVMSDKEFVGAFVSSEAAKELIFDRIAKRLSQKPSILSEVQDRLENDSIVDLDDIS